MDKKRAIVIWIAMAIAIGLIAYLSGANPIVAAIVGIATGTVYWKQKKLIDNAARFNIDLKAGKINPADLRRMYFSGGKDRKDALFIASQAMRCSVQEAEKQLSARISKQAANQEMMKQQRQQGGKRKAGRPR